jgi:hypothetical protein
MNKTDDIILSLKETRGIRQIFLTTQMELDLNDFKK